MLPRISNTTGCGVKGDKTRIIGGTDAAENEFPWICSVLKEDLTFYGCAATLLTCFPTVIIVSAAHCFKRRTQQEISKLQLACGDHKNSGFIASNIDSNEWRVKIESITIHPRYEGALTYWDNDIAVIKISLQDELQFSLVCRPQVIWPACWPERGEQYEWWRDSELAGWGTVNTGGITLPANLQTTTVLPVSQFGCENKMGEFRITDNMICGFGDGTDTCQGDSGGPMTSQAQAGGGYSLIGITSWGDGCAMEDTYGVYTRVERYMDWVAQQYGYSGVG